MKNKETVNGQVHDRPCFYTFQDNSTGIYWMIPFSSQVSKFKKIYNSKIQKYKCCDTIAFGEVLGHEKAFLIQNMCPITSEYIKNEYIDSNANVPVRVNGVFDIGDYIVYGHNGICQVVDITHPDVSGADNDRLYYVLIPEKTRDSKLFCPADNDRIVIRKVISAEEANAIIEESKTIEPLWIESDRMRDDSYKNVMKNCDLRQCVQVIKALLIRKKQREDSGKKITATDERYLKMAEEGLYSELAIATGQDREEIKKIIIGNCS